MIFWFRDIKTNEIYQCGNDEDAEMFQEQYENPADLIYMDSYYCDGSGWNGHVSKCCFGKDYDSMKLYEFDMEMTNNTMEYTAVIEAMNYANADSLILSDSQLIVNQVMLDWHCNYPHLLTYKNECQRLVQEKNLILKWIPREQNLAGIYLEDINRRNK